MQDSCETKMISNAVGLKERIRKETVALLYRALPGSVMATIIIAILLSAVLFQFSEDRFLILWLVIITGVNVVRIFLYKSYSKIKGADHDVGFWGNAFYALLILNGSCFSVIGIWFLPDAASAYHYFPIMVLIGLATGAVSSLSFGMRNITTYFILLVLPILISEVFVGTFLSYSIAALIALSLIFSLANAKRINQTSIENITLQFNSEKHNQELKKSEYAAIEANKTKTTFISLMSHELRTPLNAILGYCQLLRMSDSPQLNDEQNEQAQGITDAGSHLLSLIEEILELSNMELKKAKIENRSVSILSALDQSLSMVNPIANEHNINIVNNVERDLFVKADEKRLKQIFINLISNAIKYNDENGHIIINARLQENNTVRISIADDGYGMTKEHQKKLFKPFQQFDINKDGVGLGLYIVKNLVEMMNAKIHCESEDGKGTIFYLDFPLYH